MKKNKQENIDEYIQGKFSASEKADFEKSMAEDPIFREEVKRTKQLVAGLGAIHKERLKQQLQVFDQHPETKIETDHQVPLKVRRLRLWGVVATVAAALLLILIIKNSNSENISREQLFAENFALPSYNSIAGPDKGINTDYDTSGSKTNVAFLEILEHYKNNETTQALELIQLIEGDSLDESIRPAFLYLSGILYLHEEHYREARGFLQNNDAANASARKWYMALLLLKTNAPKAALVEAFSSIADDTTNPWRSEAENILRKMRKLD